MSGGGAGGAIAPPSFGVLLSKFLGICEKKFLLLTVAPHKTFASAHPAQIHDIDCTLQCHQFSDFTICSNILIDRKSKYYYLYCSVYYEQECWEPLKVARRCFGGAGVAIWEQLDIARLRFHANWACYIFFTWPMYCCMYSSVPNKRLGQKVSWIEL